MSDCVTNAQVVTVFDPLITEGTPPACGTGPNPNLAACSDPQYASENPLLCPNSSPLVSLSITPASGSINVANAFGFRAIAHYASGSLKDVTEDSLWSAGNADIAAMLSAGLMLGIGVGSTTIAATFKGLSAYATLTVSAQCVMDNLDVCIVMDVSQSMGCDVDCDGVITNLETAKAAVKALISNAKFTDQIAVVQFGGIITQETDGTFTKLPNTQIVQQLTLDKEVAANAVDSTARNEPCVSLIPTFTMKCASGIGGGLQLAAQELMSVRARASAKKVIVLCTDGVEDVCNPDPIVVSSDAKSNDILIIVAAIGVPDLGFFDCDAVLVSSHAYLLEIASNGLAYFVDSEDFSGLLSRIPNIICEGGYGYGNYYYVIPPSHHYLDQLDYTGFINWIVEGTVDLIGRDLYVLIEPTEERGAYVDMMGTNNNGFPGALLSRTFFDLQPGRYRVALEAMGDHRIKRPVGEKNLKIKISLPGNDGFIGDLWSTVIEIDDYLQPFKPYVFEFNIVTPTQSYLKIEQWDFPSTDFVRTVGTPIDNVLFANLDTAEVLLYDDFNDENPA